MTTLSIVPWAGGKLPRNAQEATTWITQGWDPSQDDISRMGPATAAQLGLEYVKVTPRWGLIFGFVIVAGLFFFLRRR